jgi:PAS domain-containing protein
VSVELKVTLVGDDPQQQQAFNQPTATAAPVQPTSQPSTSPSQPASSQASPPSTAKSPPPPPPVQGAQPPPVHGIETRLIDTIEQLIKAIDEQTESSKSQPSGRMPRQQGQDQTWFDRFTRTVDEKLNDLGMANTSIGNLVSGASHSFAGLGNRATKFATNVFGRSATETVAAGAQAAGSAAAGASAEAGAGAAAGAGATAAGASVAGPLILVALAAGAAALSVKKFMEAVESVAQNLADLSPDIAAGQAQHEMRLELMRLDRANRIGPDVAGLQQAQNRLSESMYELQTKIYELILKAAPAIEVGVDLLNVIVRTMDVQIATMNQIAATLTVWDPADDKVAAKALKDSLDGLGEAWKEVFNANDQLNNGIDPFLMELLTVNGGAGAPQAPRQAPPPRPPRKKP